jgi:hypothetical protein
MSDTQTLALKFNPPGFLPGSQQYELTSETKKKISIKINVEKFCTMVTIGFWGFNSKI